MKKTKKFKEGKEDPKEDSTSQNQRQRDNHKNKKKEKEPLFPFNKMIYQEKGENENNIHDYEMGSHQELNLGESESRVKKRTLREERDPGHEP